MSEVPEDLLYSRQHEWIRIEGSESTVGITDYAQDQLGDLTYVELPEIDETYDQGTEVGVVESVKAASDVYSPVEGTVIEINEELDTRPELINEDPYGEGWLYKMHHDDDPDLSNLMDAEAYEAYIDQEGE